MRQELEDWEVLHNSDSDSIDLDEVDEGQDDILRSDYFSSHHPSRIYFKTSDENQMVRIESDNSFCVDRGSITECVRKNSDGIFLDSSVHRLDEYLSSDSALKNKQGFLDKEVSEEGYDGGEKTETKTKPLGELICEETPDCFTVEESKLNEIDFGVTEFAKCPKGFKESGELEAHDVDSSKHSDREGLVALKTESMEKDDQTTSADNVNKPDGFQMPSKPGNGISSLEVIEATAGSGGKGQNRSLIWWKMPFELLKYCGFKIRPFWSLSVVAAVMGFFLLGRQRLYKMKKVERLQLKITLDDNKKTSQVMNRAARLNGAFSEIRRVPIIRHALPASGGNPWPLMRA